MALMDYKEISDAVAQMEICDGDTEQKIIAVEAAKGGYAIDDCYYVLGFERVIELIGLDAVKEMAEYDNHNYTKYFDPPRPSDVAWNDWINRCVEYGEKTMTNKIDASSKRTYKSALNKGFAYPSNRS